MQIQPLEIKAFPPIRLDLVLHIVPQIRYLRFTLKGRRVPWLRRWTCTVASPNKLDTYFNHQQAPFSDVVAGEQVIKIQSSLRL
jgi:hypothetical protein